MIDMPCGRLYTTSVSLALTSGAVISKEAQLLGHNPARRVRVIAIMLLASLWWGATAEFTHHHGRASQSLLSPSQAVTTAAEADARFVQSGDSEGARSTSRSRSECLICQLHQNLSTILLSSPPGCAPVELGDRSAPTRTVFQISEFAANQHGRAPPATSLS